MFFSRDWVFNNFSQAKCVCVCVCVCMCVRVYKNEQMGRRRRFAMVQEIVKRNSKYHAGLSERLFYVYCQSG